MRKVILTPVCVGKVVLLVLIFALILGWSTSVSAQTAADAQYKSPTATAAGNPAASGSTTEGGGAAKAGGSGGGAAKAGGSGTSAKVLPSTGGPLLPLVALGTLALSSAGLLVLRQLYRR